MKVTVFPREKATYRAVAWYAKHASPVGVDAYVDSIGDSTLSLSIDKKVFIGGLSVTPVRVGEPQGTLCREVEVYIELVLEAARETDIVKFIETAKSEYEKKCTEVEKDPKFVKVLQWDGCYWSCDYKTSSRTRKTMYVPEIDHLFDDLKNFYDKEDRYLELEIPYARTYMLHGLPGTGKTSVIYTVASELKKNLAIIDFSDRDLSDRYIRMALYKMPNDTILCLEDIDSLFSADRKTDKSTITFSGILNILDGVVKNTGLVIFMTTNLLSNLDDTAMRRRVDYYLKFDVMKKAQITDMFTKFYPGQDPKRFLEAVGKTVFTPCILQKFFVRHLETSDITEHVDELIHMCTNEYKLSKSSDALYT
jgi:hypothetical protein